MTTSFYASELAAPRVRSFELCWIYRSDEASNYRNTARRQNDFHHASIPEALQYWTHRRASAKPRPPRPARKPQLPALTGIRTLLAFNIVLFHFTPPHLGLLRPFVENGFVFVNVFFLISGYILTYNYSDRGASLNKREFWLARFSRLYPVYLLVLIISMKMVQLEWHARPPGQFWAGMILTPLLLQGMSPTLATFWNTVAWTLSCEVALYAAFPWLIRLPWPRKPSRLIFLILLFWIGNMIPAQLYLHLNPSNLPTPITRYSSSTMLRFLKYTPLPYACTFLAGITLARLQLVTTITQRQRFAIAAASLAALGVFFYRISPTSPT